jgi:hypothetical protein
MCRDLHNTIAPYLKILCFVAPGVRKGIGESNHGVYHCFGCSYRVIAQPVPPLTGMHYRDLIGTLAQQDVELDKRFEDVAVFNQRVMGLISRRKSGRPGLPDPNGLSHRRAHRLSDGLAGTGAIAKAGHGTRTDCFCGASRFTTAKAGLAAE